MFSRINKVSVPIICISKNTKKSITNHCLVIEIQEFEAHRPANTQSFIVPVLLLFKNDIC